MKGRQEMQLRNNLADVMNLNDTICLPKREQLS